MQRLNFQLLILCFTHLMKISMCHRKQIRKIMVSHMQQTSLPHLSIWTITVFFIKCSGNRNYTRFSPLQNTVPAESRKMAETHSTLYRNLPVYIKRKLCLICCGHGEKLCHHEFLTNVLAWHWMYVYKSYNMIISKVLIEYRIFRLLHYLASGLKSTF